MRYDIYMKVISVKPIHEITLGDDKCIEVIIDFECETPLGESDTCAMLARYFDDIYFEESDEDSFDAKGDIFCMRGVIKVPYSEKSDLVCNSEITIPISSSLKKSLALNSYIPEDIRSNVISWIGGLTDEE
ncbi:hypothetical protein [Erwinia amylovora]|uniref:hypothetical protein n=1 Tax=Erwinia amylovora TaxID=552 RepID=UPI000C073B12|nr:hypothetical protein [Erwinia amylovora]